VVRRGRAKLLHQAAEMREQKASPRKRMIPAFQRLAISFSLTAAFLASGTGLVGASSTALPGENLYPVKRTWEDVRLFFTFNPTHKELLESEFESERLGEVSELLAEGRHETIQFAGVFMQVNGVTYVSGVTVIIPSNLQVPADGAAVVVTGRTNAQGFVEVEAIELLPEGSMVPVGNPVEVDNESGSNSGPGSEGGSDSNSSPGSDNESGSGSENEVQATPVVRTPEAGRQSFETTGAVQSITGNSLMINGQKYILQNARIQGVLQPGVNVEIKGYYASDGSFIVTEVKVKDFGLSGGGSSSSGSDDGGSSGGSDDGSDSESDSGGGGDD
jgi:hypothetical protein